MALAIPFVLMIISTVGCVSSLDSNTTDYCTNQNCPPWMVDNEDGCNSKCVCKETLPESFSCSEGTVYLDILYCMSFDNDSVSVGACPYIHQNVTGFEVELPESVSELNSVFCEPLNREGDLCHRCKEGFGVAPLSLKFACAECSDNTWPWWLLFLFLEFVPVTIFYLVNLVWQVSFATAPFKCFVFVSQISFWTMANIKSVVVTRNRLSVLGRVWFDIVKCLNGIWSLDFFLSVLPPFCVSTSFTSVHIFYVWYSSALYPLFLVLLTFILHKLHDRNFKPITYLWQPFRRCFLSTRQVRDHKTSIVNVFSNFCLFSFSKVLLIVTTSFQWSIKRDVCVPKQCYGWSQLYRTLTQYSFCRLLFSL